MAKKISKTVKKSVTAKKTSQPAKSTAKKMSKSAATPKPIKKTAKKTVRRQSSPVKSEQADKTTSSSTISLKNRSEKEKELFEKLKELLLKRKMDIIYSFDEADPESDTTIKQSGVGDMVDSATDAVEIEINLKLAEFGSRELGQIDNALAKMNEGSYGICESCSGNISMARIKALPFATKCIKCQQEEDENGQQDF